VLSALSQNTVTVDDAFTSPGWDDKRGFGELITFKGGEAPGDAGAKFQVLDVRNRFSFERVGVNVRDFRRALLAVEGPDGRPYVVDVLALRGGQRQALYQSALGRTRRRAPAAGGSRGTEPRQAHVCQRGPAVVGDVRVPAEMAPVRPGGQGRARAGGQGFHVRPPRPDARPPEPDGRAVTLTDNRIDLAPLLGARTPARRPTWSRKWRRPPRRG